MSGPLFILTDDGSHTLKHPTFLEHYHSTFGALQESRHVFIQSALEYYKSTEGGINILEIGFGTGLNALLALQWAEKEKINIKYTGVEVFPISMEVARKLNFPNLLNLDKEMFLKMHDPNTFSIHLTAQFHLNHIRLSLQETSLPDESFNVVFFDAFSPDVQPELWTVEVFLKIFLSMKKNSVLTTYSCKGIVKRALREAGFKIKRLPGPPGKREMLRAIKE